MKAPLRKAGLVARPLFTVFPDLDFIFPPASGATAVSSGPPSSDKLSQTALFYSTSVDPVTPLPRVTAVDKGKLKMVKIEEDGMRSKKFSSPSGVMFHSPFSNQDRLELPEESSVEQDVVLAELKSQRKKVHVKKHQAIFEMQKELLRLIQSVESGLDDHIPGESKLVEEAGLTMPPPLP